MSAGKSEMTQNVVGGPLDGGFIEPHDTDEAVAVAKRVAKAWHWYRWNHEDQKWVFVRSQSPVLRTDE